MKKFIYAPHVDDEVIGCSQLLDEDTLVVYVCEHMPIEERQTEARAAASRLGHTPTWLHPNSIGEAMSTICRAYKKEPFILLAPDPHWENHPDHRMLGSLILRGAEQIGARFGTYSTNMQAPYIRELPPIASDAKHKLLNSCFPSQRSLWETDHRYFLFEGVVEWNPPLG